MTGQPDPILRRPHPAESQQFLPVPPQLPEPQLSRLLRLLFLQSRNGGVKRVDLRIRILESCPPPPPFVESEEQDQRIPQLPAGHDTVHEAMFLQIFRPLESLGQLLTDGLLDDAGTGKADERARLRQGDIRSQAGKAGAVTPPVVGWVRHRR